MTLSSRAKAFSVDSLLHSPPKSSSSSSSFSHSSEDDTNIKEDFHRVNEHRADDIGQGELTCREVDISPCPSVPERLLQTETPTATDEYFPEKPLPSHDNGKLSVPVPDTQNDNTVTTCFCHGDMSFCMHPGVISVADRNGCGPTINAELLHSDLWFKFHRLGTEMIITKSGRRMFPSLKLRVNGLDPAKTYETRLEFLQPDCKKYRYIYHSSRWMVSGSGDALATTPSHVAPECPMSGQTVCSQALSFERLKLTNSECSKPGQVSLVSMQKFQPQVVIQEVDGTGRDAKTLEYYQIVFAQTSFMAVTAYQNQQITTLKIASNPFAKGFRDAGKLRYPYEGSKVFSHQHNPTAHMGLGLGFNELRAFQPPPTHPMLEAIEGRLREKRSHSNPWELEAGEKCVKAARFDIFNLPQSLPFTMHPHFGIPSYIAPGYPPASLHDLNIQQTNSLRHDLPMFPQSTRIPTIDTDNIIFPYPHPSSSLLSLSSSSLSPPSSSSSSPTPSSSRLSSSADNRTSPTFYQNHKIVQKSESSISQHCLSTAPSPNPQRIPTPKRHCSFSERTKNHSSIKEELQTDNHNHINYCSRQRDHHHHHQYQSRGNSPPFEKIEHHDRRMMHHDHHMAHTKNVSYATAFKPLMPLNNHVDNQRNHSDIIINNNNNNNSTDNNNNNSTDDSNNSNNNNSTNTHSATKTIPTPHSCTNCAVCLDQSLKRIPYFYRHPFGIHGQYETERSLSHP